MNYHTVYDYTASDEMLHLYHDISVFYMYYSSMRDISVVMNGGFCEEESPAAYDEMTDGRTTYETRLASSRSDRFAHALLTFDKGFSIPLRAKINIYGTVSLKPSYYGGVAYTMETKAAETSISVKTRFKCPVNVEIGGGLNWSTTSIGILDKPSEWRTYDIRIQPLVASKKSGVKVKLPISYVSDKAGDEALSYVDLSLSAEKRIGRHASIYAEANDILHTDSRDRITRTVEGDHEDTATEARMPGFALIGFKWVF